MKVTKGRESINLILLAGGPKQESIVHRVGEDNIAYRYKGTDYQLRLISNRGFCKQLTNGDIQIHANASGSLDIELAPAAAETNQKTTHTAALTTD